MQAPTTWPLRYTDMSAMDLEEISAGIFCISVSMKNFVKEDTSVRWMDHYLYDDVLLLTK